MANDDPGTSKPEWPFDGNELRRIEQRIAVVEERLANIEDIAQAIEHSAEEIETAAESADETLKAILALLKVCCGPHGAEIVIGPPIGPVSKEKTMAKKMALKCTGKGPKAVAPPVTMTQLTAGATLEPLDASGNPSATPFDPTLVTASWTVDNPSLLTLSPSASNPLAQNLTSADGTGGVVVLSAVVTYNDGSAGPFNASVQITIPPGPPVDAIIVIGPVVP